jgi:hypothetical protein
MNSDGLFDIVAGSADGYIYLFLNTGSSGAPLFMGPAFLECGGRPIHHISATRPYVTDWNHDGCTDLLVGDMTGNVILYPGLPTPAEEGEHAGGFSVTVLSNPVSDVLTMEIDGAVPGPVTVLVYSMDGRLVLRDRLETGSSGSGVFHLQMPRGNGALIMRCIQQDTGATARFVRVN